MLNKSFIAFNVLHKINMLKPYTDIFKSQYTIWQRANFRSWYVFWLESLYPYQQIDTGISYCSGRSYCDLCRTHVINTELYPRWVFFSDHKSGSQFPSGSTKSCFGKSTLGSPARCRSKMHFVFSTHQPQRDLWGSWMSERPFIFRMKGANEYR